jgi:hypothetical protein
MPSILAALLRCLPALPGIAAGFLWAAGAGAQPIVWTGPTITFTKPAFAFPPPEDQLTANVAFTRGDSQGLYNAAQESFYSFGVSPADTAWATSRNNPGEMISATNWAALNFTTWESAYGGPGNLALEITQRDAVVHLVTDDIYLDLRFTQWSVGSASGGSFSYDRSTPLATAPSGDYNGNGVVDAADYVIWRKALNEPAVPAGSGADGNANGTIDSGDYDFWAARFGNTVPGAGAARVLAVPEPAALVLLVIGLAIANAVWRKRA